MIEVLGVKNADKLVPTADDVNPTDPVSENMAALVGKASQSVYLPRPRRSYSYTYGVYARPTSCSDDWAEPAGTADYGFTTGAYR